MMFIENEMILIKIDCLFLIDLKYLFLVLIIYMILDLKVFCLCILLGVVLVCFLIECIVFVDVGWV